MKAKEVSLGDKGFTCSIPTETCTLTRMPTI